MSRENDKSWGNFTPRNYGNAQCGNNLAFKSANMLSNMPEGCIVSIRNGSDTVRGDFGGIRIFDGGVESTYFKIKIFRDDDVVNPVIDAETQTDFRLVGYDELSLTDVIVITTWYPETFYKRNSDGSRFQNDGVDVPVFNSEKKVFELDQYLYNESYPSYPTKPPYMKGGVYYPAEWWNGTEYVATSTKGLRLQVYNDDSYPVFYRKLTDADTELKKWPRMASPIVMASLTDEEVYIKPSDISLPLPYYKTTSSPFYTNGSYSIPRSPLNGNIKAIVSIPYTVSYSYSVYDYTFADTALDYSRDYTTLTIEGYNAGDWHNYIKKTRSCFTLEDETASILYTDSIHGQPFYITRTNPVPEVTSLLEERQYFAYIIFPSAESIVFPTVYSPDFYPYKHQYAGHLTITAMFIHMYISAQVSIDGTYEYSSWHLGEDPPSF